MQAKPFLKWAGGKSRLLTDIEKSLPYDFNIQFDTYIEPFVGGGAVLFWILDKFPNIKNVIINDVNSDLINVYKVIKKKPTKLIEYLKVLQNEFHSFEFDDEGRKNYYYEKRALFNSRNSNDLEQAGIFIFLNRTCFNGLYRVNKKNEFNVPIGSYLKPQICDSHNISQVSKILKEVKILSGDYQRTINYINDKTLFYLDPPYKPLNKTSNFNSYSNSQFNDKEQIRLRDFCKLLDKKAYWILSNSDVKVEGSEDTFFDDLYCDYDINRVKVKRFINNNSKSKHLSELLIVNKIEEEIVLIHN
ncbi:modification methylase [Flavobacterium crocinum]|uniref:site-specific DNA-methyltransferase (adenine-specific) n=1 Tax=Flavobacterium crocinum TaxID=2183896 RepID=A0A2S1YSA8_9FLAO|nr:DNA adenine methylase [Flavobacterium crocinum]AWK06990.1 modification methylase [Flavobacterium crocinum]